MNEKRKKRLLKRQQRLSEKKNELVARAESSESVEEVRSIYEKLKETSEELNDIAEEIKEIEDEQDDEEVGEEAGENKEGRSNNIQEEQFEMRGAEIVGAYRQQKTKRSVESDVLDTEEYQKAFMEYVCRSRPIPENIKAMTKREDEITSTSDAGAVIPTTIWNEIIKEMDSYGNVYALVTKLNVQGGLRIPILSLKPEATWIGEEKTSETKKLEANESITFNYYGVECKIAQTLLASVVTLETFQKLFVPMATEAIVKAIEIAIFRGSGNNQPLGIINDKRVKSEKVVTLSPQEMTWNGWHKVKGKMKKAYRNGTFFMNQATFDEKIDGMEDKQGQPIGRTNYGIGGEETYRFMGKMVETVEDECLPSYDDANVGEVFAIFMNPKDYVINTNMKMRVVKWEDNDTNEIKNKCILICDGRIADANGVILIKKGKNTEPPASDADTDAEG